MYKGYPDRVTEGGDYTDDFSTEPYQSTTFKNTLVAHPKEHRSRIGLRCARAPTSKGLKRAAPPDVTMQPAPPLAAVSAASPSTTAPPPFSVAKASGTLVIDDKKFAIRSVVAKTDLHLPDGTTKNTLILLTDTAVSLDGFDKTALNRLAKQGKIHGLILTFDQRGRATDLDALGSGSSESGGICECNLSRFDLNGIAGTASRKPDRIMSPGYGFDIQFESPVHDGVTIPVDEVTGTPLPAGGGEPGAAYLECDKSIQAGDIQSIKNCETEGMQNWLDAPDAQKQALIAMRLKLSEVTRGFVSGDRATLFLGGTSPGTSGAPSEPIWAKVTMVKLGGQWKVSGETWHI
jgi:hypothetical protein